MKRLLVYVKNLSENLKHMTIVAIICIEEIIDFFNISRG